MLHGARCCLPLTIEWTIAELYSPFVKAHWMVSERMVGEMMEVTVAIFEALCFSPLRISWSQAHM